MNTAKRRRRWTKAQRVERTTRPTSLHYEAEGGRRIVHRLHEPVAYRESYVADRLGIGLSDLQDACLLEVGGTALVDAYAYDVAASQKVCLDPLPHPIVSEDCAFVRGVGERMPLRAQSVHICWTTNTVDHCADPAAFLTEIRRVLRPEGRLFITCNVFGWWARPLFPVFNLLDSPHPHHFSRSSFLGLLLRAGFVINLELEPWVPPVRGWRPLSSLKVAIGRAMGLRQVQARCCVRARESLSL